METNLQEIKRLTKEINELKEELEKHKKVVYEGFVKMSEEDLALCENKMSHDNVNIQYFPKSTTRTVDTNKLKEDGLYEKYTKITVKKDFIKVAVK